MYKFYNLKENIKNKIESNKLTNIYIYIYIISLSIYFGIRTIIIWKHSGSWIFLIFLYIFIILKNFNLYNIFVFYKCIILN